MAASFIQTEDGLLISTAGALSELHIGHTRLTPRGEAVEPAVFMDRHVVGQPAPGGDVNRLLLNLIARAARVDGVFGIADGSIFHRTATESHGAQTMHHGTGENMVWGDTGTTQP